MAGATEHQVTIAFVNLGLVENAFLRKKLKQHLEEIQRIVDQLFQYHSIHILCVVEVGQPTIGLSDEAKKLFEEAVRAGAAKHIRGDLTFLWADCNEAMVTVHVAGMNMTKGAIIDGLFHTQSWRNAMPFYLHGPTDQDRIVIFLSHQPSSALHKLSMQCRQSVVKKLIDKGLNQRDWPDGVAKPVTIPRFILGGDLSTNASTLRMLAELTHRSR